ncbi:redoxin family protein [Fusobacterium sp.]|uniref:redoxin family protein n=1 Tax=Bacteria TaxID=2 RepID=UPI0025B7B092|nr:redoxin family protein [Fusobacterium sp.]MCI5725171.1 redoxin family protein [Fusobacterium sp.]
MLEAGVKAPEFKLQDKDGNLVSLSDFKNKKIVVYFKMDPIWWTREKACLSIWDLFLYNIN